MRRSGVIMHITSLPSDYGIGSLGREAFNFIDFLSQASQRCWQVLPIGQTGYGDSPYQTVSAFGGNVYMIDLESLIEEGLLTKEEAEAVTWSQRPDKVYFGIMYEHRMSVLKQAFLRFNTDDQDYRAFLENEKEWLIDVALFMALKSHFNQLPWTKWPNEIKKRDPYTLECYKILLRDEVSFQCFMQYEFFKQWEKVKAYSLSKGIEIIGDIPIYVPEDSVDTWAHPECFDLDENDLPRNVAGVPPDYFCAEGQLWGNPLYRWDDMKANNYEWWIARLRQAFRLFDVVRIDHFRGIESYWSVPFGEKTAVNGIWKKGPGKDFIITLKESFPDKSFIAEDLGLLTDEVRNLLEYSGFPGMKILEFAFDSHEPSDYLPHRYEKNCVCYTGTHDNETLSGWLNTSEDWKKEYIREYFGGADDEGLRWSIISGGMRSAADLFMVQLQDYLGIGNEGRMNRPGVSDGDNWCWRLKSGQLDENLANRIARLTRMYER